jgi:anti-anti-sigma factor
MIQLNRSNPEYHTAELAGPLDNRTADGFDEWLRKYADHFGAKGTLLLDMTKLECLSSRAISSIVYFYELFKGQGGNLKLTKVPPTAMVSLEKLGFIDLDLIWTEEGEGE